MDTFMSRVACYKYRKNDLLHMTGNPYVGCSVLWLNCTTNLKVQFRVGFRALSWAIGLIKS